jgi:hypothetical protein
MDQCEVCGNEYESLMTIRLKSGITHQFDCFECAVHKLAPTCADCGVRVLGHGVQVDHKIYCCAHCAHAQGATEIVDHVNHRNGSANNHQHP